MTEIVSINDIIDIIKEKLTDDGKVILKVTGNSMYPFLINRSDSVMLTKQYTEFKKGDIVLFKYYQNWVLHRIVKIKKGQLIICGDALTKYEYASQDGVLAVVEKIIRNEKEIDVKTFSYRFKVKLWMLLKPVRRYLVWFLQKIWKR